jgi:hypothetical protein
MAYTSAAASLERAGTTSLIDVLDRVLDKGIVTDAWLRVSLVGVDLITVEARMLVASIQTYVQHADAVAEVMAYSRPARLSHPGSDAGAVGAVPDGVPSSRPARQASDREPQRVTKITRQLDELQGLINKVPVTRRRLAIA